MSVVPREAYFAVVKEAKRLGISFVGHVPEGVTAAEASQAVQRSLEHLFGVLSVCAVAEQELRKHIRRIQPAANSRPMRVSWRHSASRPPPSSSKNSEGTAHGRLPR